MSLHYFIDGHNLLHSTTRWTKSNRAGDREQLLRYLEEEWPLGSARNAMTVVFDGHPARFGTLRLKTVRVLFSLDQDADDIIKERVDEMANAKNAVVVTNDRAIQKWVQGAGAKVLSCEDFLRLQQKPVRKGTPEKPTTEVEGKINEEMKRIWNVK